MDATLDFAAAVQESTAERFQRYYEESGPDYAAWSPNFNMHFGYFRRGMNPLRREAMLEQMNREVLSRLHLCADSRGRVLDMGCGLGASLRSIAGQCRSAELYGITRVPWQLEQGCALNHCSTEGRSIRLLLGDYEHVPLPTASFDAVCAVESSCYSAGADKAALLREAHRLLRPGGRMVVADGFLGPGRLSGPQKSIYRRLCDCWVIETFAQVDAFAGEMVRLGFRDVVVEPAQWRVAPSVMHVPWVTLKFLLGTVLRGKTKMTRARWNNVLAPVLLPLVGYPLGPVGYYIISATRT
jgi:ubiquinone/menaquinone biosynthesis C-methylase UbiE